MSPRDERALLFDIVAACRNIESFIAGVDVRSFRAEKMTQCAIQHQIMVIGEATKLLSAEFRQDHPEIPWAPIARMRDKLIHGYASVDLELVWKTATERVPQLLAALEPWVPPEPPR